MENEEIVESSGNIFEDLGFPDAEEAQAKSKLAIEIFLIIKAKRLTQKEAAKIMKTSQSHVSDILRGKLSNFTIDRLLRCLLALGKDVEIKIKKPKTNKQQITICLCDKTNKNRGGEGSENVNNPQGYSTVSNCS